MPEPKKTGSIAQTHHLAEDLGDLSLAHPSGSGSGRSSARKPATKQPVADSWEDEEDDDDGYFVASPDTPNANPSTSSSPTHHPPPHPSLEPPLNPSSAPLAFGPDGTPLAPSSASGTSAPPNTPNPGVGAGQRRPEKTTGPAARMIAGALGVRAPKKTDEQRQYERAVKEKEARRRNEESERRRLEEAERERLTREAWDG